jgi:hypothetical protein
MEDATKTKQQAPTIVAILLAAAGAVGYQETRGAPIAAEAASAAAVKAAQDYTDRRVRETEYRSQLAHERILHLIERLEDRMDVREGRDK